MAVNIHITIIELNALHTKRQNLFQRSEERFSRNAETELVCRLLLEKKNEVLPPIARFFVLIVVWALIVLTSYTDHRPLHSFPTRRSSDLSINFSVTDTNSSRTSEAALWPSTYISPLSNSTPCIRKDRISSKSLMRLSICLWKPSIGD